MPVQDTSRSAYADLRASLTARQLTVWTALRDYPSPPTAYELLRGMREADPNLDLNDVRPRLTEMAGRYVEKCGKRPCRVTTKLATTWRAILNRPPVKPQPKLHTPADLNRAKDGCLF